MGDPGVLGLLGPLGSSWGWLRMSWRKLLGRDEEEKGEVGRGLGLLLQHLGLWRRAWQGREGSQGRDELGCAVFNAANVRPVWHMPVSTQFLLLTCLPARLFLLPARRCCRTRTSHLPRRRLPRHRTSSSRRMIRSRRRRRMSRSVAMAASSLGAWGKTAAITMGSGSCCRSVATW